MDSYIAEMKNVVQRKLTSAKAVFQQQTESLEQSSTILLGLEKLHHHMNEATDNLISVTSEHPDFDYCIFEEDQTYESSDLKFSKPEECLFNEFDRQ